MLHSLRGTKLLSMSAAVALLLAAFASIAGLAGLSGGETQRALAQSECLEAATVASIIEDQAAPTATRTPTPINIGNFVWDDLDQDGRQDAGEPGIAGVTVQLWNAAKNSLIASTTTNSSGNYTVVAPVPGDYRVRVLLPNPAADAFSPKDATTDTTDSDINPSGGDSGFTDAFNLASNLISTTTIDAGIILFRTPTPTRTPTPINVGNFVWDDLNGNGVQDGGEPGIPGVQVQLWNDAKNNLIATTTTNSSGNYTVVAPVPGDYRLRVLPPSGRKFTLKDQGNDQSDSDINPDGADAGFTDAFNLASNLISTTTKDAGLIPGNFVPPPTATSISTPTPTSTSNAPATNTPAAGGTSTATPCVSATVVTSATAPAGSTQGPASTATPGSSTTSVSTAPVATATAVPPTSGTQPSAPPSSTTSPGAGTAIGGSGQTDRTSTAAPGAPATGTGAATANGRPGAWMLLCCSLLGTGAVLAVVGRRRKV